MTETCIRHPFYAPDIRSPFRAARGLLVVYRRNGRSERTILPILAAHNNWWGEFETLSEWKHLYNGVTILVKYGGLILKPRRYHVERNMFFLWAQPLRS